MLHFFRKYQKFFFIFTTIIIVTSFVFFGTYQAFAPSFKSSEKDEVLFRSLDGKKIFTSHFEAMSRFLSSENWMLSQKPMATNFLNDGVISKEFLDSGLIFSLVPFLSDAFTSELTEKLKKEKEYTPYAHPYVQALSAMSIWAVFAPEIPEKLAMWKSMEKPAEPAALEGRVSLFLAQKRFPPAFLSQVIRYQQKEYLSQGLDPRLMKDDLGLFGYQTLEDWFGNAFMDGVCRSIIQTAALARKKGYRVTKEEALSDLLVASQKMYEAMREKMDLPVSNGYGLFQIYLRQNGFDEKVVLAIWEDIILFRKYVHEIGNAALVDFMPVENFYSFAHENVTLELHQLPKELRFESFQDLKKFEAYLEAVGAKRASLLDLPVEYAAISEIEKKAPELVGKKYRLYVAEVTNESLSGKVTVKETWNWECALENWEKLKKEFPELAQKTGAPFEILESVDVKTRGRIDAFSRKQIASQHPEWALEILKEKNMDEKLFFLTASSVKPLDGIKDPIAFGKLLDEKEEIVGYSQDGEHYYRLLVQQKSDEKEVLTFKEALKEGCLDKIAERLHIQDNAQKVVEQLSAKYFSSKNALRNEDKAPSYRFVEILGKQGLVETDLTRQWKPEKKDLTLTRSESSFISFSEALSLEANGVSNVKVDSKEGAYYYRLLDKKVDTSVPMEKIVQTQELLSKEAKKVFFEDVLKKIYHNPNA